MRAEFKRAAMGRGRELPIPPDFSDHGSDPLRFPVAVDHDEPILKDAVKQARHLGYMHRELIGLRIKVQMHVPRPVQQHGDLRAVEVQFQVTPLA